MTRPWPVGQCRVCLGWGEKPQFADCSACSSWRHLHPDVAPCRRCGHDSHVNTDGLCLALPAEHPAARPGMDHSSGRRAAVAAHADPARRPPAQGPAPGQAAARPGTRPHPATVLARPAAHRLGRAGRRPAGLPAGCPRAAPAVPHATAAHRRPRPPHQGPRPRRLRPPAGGGDRPGRRAGPDHGVVEGNLPHAPAGPGRPRVRRRRPDHEGSARRPAQVPQRRRRRAAPCGADPRRDAASPAAGQPGGRPGQPAAELRALRLLGHPEALRELQLLEAPRSSGRRLRPGAAARAFPCWTASAGPAACTSTSTARRRGSSHGPSCGSAATSLPALHCGPGRSATSSRTRKAGPGPPPGGRRHRRSRRTWPSPGRGRCSTPAATGAASPSGRWTSCHR